MNKKYKKTYVLIRNFLKKIVKFVILWYYIIRDKRSKNMNEEKDPTKEVQESGVKLLEKEDTTEKIEDLNEAETTEENTNENEDKQNEKNNSSKKIKIILGILIILIIFSLIFSVIFAFINAKSSKIVKGTIIEQIDVSNLTQEEAKEKLDKVYQSKSDKQIYLKYGEYETSITYEALEVEYQI